VSSSQPEWFFSAREIFPLPPPRNDISPGELRLIARFDAAPKYDETRRILKIPRSAQVSAQITKLLERGKDLAVPLVRLSAIYGIFHPEAAESGWFAGAAFAGLAVVTIGERLEEEVARLTAADQITLALILDALGSGWVEGAVEAIDEVFGLEAAALGCRKDRRRSPGYHKWPLESQGVLLKKLEAERIGVRLTESNMMIPRKSVSFGVPLFKID
jgi:hypothetical protein